MAWLQLRIGSDASTAERISDWVSELGAVSVTLVDAADDPVLEPLPGQTPLWQQTVVVGLFDDKADQSAIEQALRAHGLSGLAWESVPEQDWIRAWMDQYQPMRFGERLWICPSWLSVDAPDAVVVSLDPGMAFGTGTHPTTALCLRWLDGQSLQGAEIIDYGCGSGILAIAALKLGAARAIGVDIDPQAILASRENAERNQIPESALPLGMPKLVQGQSADILIANILSGPLIELAPVLGNLCRPGGWIALSGLLAEQADEVIAAYLPWCRLAVYGEQDGWICLTGRRAP